MSMSEAPRPLVNDLNAPFWMGARAGKLLLPHCTATNRPFWPPSPVSAWDADGKVVWREAKPRGVVRAMGVYRRVFLKAFEPLTPFAIALVELEKGVRLQAHVASADRADAPRVGDVVALGFRVLVEGGEPALCAEKAPAG